MINQIEAKHSMHVPTTREMFSFFLILMFLVLGRKEGLYYSSASHISISSFRFDCWLLSNNMRFENDEIFHFMLILH